MPRSGAFSVGGTGFIVKRKGERQVPLRIRIGETAPEKLFNALDAVLQAVAMDKQLIRGDRLLKTVFYKTLECAEVVGLIPFVCQLKRAQPRMQPCVHIRSVAQLFRQAALGAV